MAILWILELLLLSNLYNQSWTDFASRINDHLVVKWVIGIAFSIHYRQSEVALSVPETREETLPHCPNTSRTKLLAPGDPDRLPVPKPNTPSLQNYIKNQIKIWNNLLFYKPGNFGNQLAPEPHLRALVCAGWCRWRAEVEKPLPEFLWLLKTITVGKIISTLLFLAQSIYPIILILLQKTPLVCNRYN